MLGYIEFESETKLGDLKLDFFKNESEAYNTIVLAGENGCGKTAILEAIAGFQRGIYLGGFSSVKKVIYFDENGMRRTILREEEAERYAELDTGEQFEPIYEFTEQEFFRERFEISNKMPYDIRNRKLVFSEARSGFEVNFERNTRGYNYEEDKYEKDGANYSGIVQLLIDLEEKDNEEYISYAKINPECVYAEYMRNNSRTSKFKRAYESIFEELSYMGKDPRRQDDTIYFTKGKSQIDISELSTGEKQIVFRGTDLLYHAEKGATIIIDEPELSLHPKWQKKILDFYRNLFRDGTEKQTVQLIIATHSQYVVQSAMDNSDDVKVIILRRDDSKINANTMEEVILGKHSSAEVNYLAFGVEKVDYHIQLFEALHNVLQGITGSGVNRSIASIDKYIKNHSFYEPSKHEREDTSFNHYYTLPVYIRNTTDHPGERRTYNDGDLEISIDLLRKIYKEVTMV